MTLGDVIITGEVKHLAVAHEGRLMRFRFVSFQHLAERHGNKIKVINQEILTPQEKMIKDLLLILHTFRCRLYGIRKYHNERQARDGIRKVIVTTQVSHKGNTEKCG